MSAPRIALVGARRVRQGLGPFVARFAREAGAEIAGVLGTTRASAAEAAAALDVPGSAPLQGYTDLRALVDAEAPDALAILSPHATHETYLERALDAGLHVLCEKPLLFGGTDLGVRAARLVQGFGAAGLLLRENCQWPHVLEAYASLFPERAGAAPSELAMELAPVAADLVGMLADALSHPLSVLQALHPDPEAGISEVSCGFSPGAPGKAPTPARLSLGFRYGSGPGSIAARIALQQSFEVPRPAALALDGHWARREVRPPDYAIHLTAQARSVKVPDPLATLVGRFVGELGGVLSGRAPEASGDVAHRMRLFETLLAAVEAAPAGAALDRAP